MCYKCGDYSCEHLIIACHAMAMQCATPCGFKTTVPYLRELCKDADVASLGKFSTALLCWLDTYYWYIYNSYAMESKLHISNSAYFKYVEYIQWLF